MLITKIIKGSIKCSLHTRFKSEGTNLFELCVCVCVSGFISWLSAASWWGLPTCDLFHLNNPVMLWPISPARLRNSHPQAYGGCKSRTFSKGQIDLQSYVLNGKWRRRIKYPCPVILGRCLFQEDSVKFNESKLKSNLTKMSQSCAFVKEETPSISSYYYPHPHFLKSSKSDKVFFHLVAFIFPFCLFADSVHRLSSMHA